jgi:NitT/TauT family transport system substrate-binding protein
MKRKSVLYTALMVLLTLTACSDGDDEAREAARRRHEQHVADSLALKVAVTPTLDCLPLYLAEQEGWFKREGVDVLLKPYTAQMDQDTALLRHHVEGMTTDRERTKWIEQQGMPVEAVATTTLKWQLITNKTARIKLLRQLDDKMVAITRFSATDMLVRRMVDSLGLKPERVFRIQVNDVGVRLSMLENSMIDAVMLPEPQATQARMAGHPVLLDTDSLGYHLGVIVFSKEVMADTMRQRQIKKFLKVYEAARDTIAARGLQHFSSLTATTCHVQTQTADSID